MKFYSERYGERKKKEPVTFSLDRLLIGALCSVVLIGITVVSFMAPALDALDKWTNQPENQIKLAFVILSCGIVLTVYMVVRRLRG